MSIRWEIDEHLGIVRITWEGRVPIEEWMRAMDAVQADLRFRPDFPFLSDRRAVTTVPTPDEIRASVNYFEIHHGRLGQTVWAIVTAPSAADFGMMRMGETLADKLIVMQYFDDFTAAERWLLEGKKTRKVEWPSR